MERQPHHLRRAPLRPGPRCSAAASCCCPASRAGGGRDLHRRRGCTARTASGSTRVAARFHTHLRARPHHPRRPRPVVLNTWEAVYFDHDLDRLTELARLRRRGRRRALRPRRRLVPAPPRRHRRARRLVRRRGRVAATACTRSSTRSAGSAWSSACGSSPRWSTSTPTSPARTPTGSWATGGRTAAPSRHQQVLDLAHPDAYAYILERLDALLAEYPIAYLKWDHNRDLLEAGHGAGRRARRARPDARASTGCSTSCAPRHPGVEIESCSSGGCRVDLEVLEHTDRVWASDVIDPLERQQIQRWTAPAAPARAGRQPRRRAAGAHHRPHARPVVPRRHRAVRLVRHRVGPRPPRPTPSARSWPSWVALYKEVRELLHTGTVVRAAAARPLLRGARRGRARPVRGAVRPGPADLPGDLGARAVRLPGPRPGAPLPRAGCSRPATCPPTAGDHPRRRGLAEGVDPARLRARARRVCAHPALFPEQLLLVRVRADPGPNGSAPTVRATAGAATGSRPAG